MKLKVLRRDHVHSIHGICERAGDNDDAVDVQRCPRDVLARTLRDQKLDGVLHLLGKSRIRGHEVAGCHGIVLRLRHEVGSDHDGVGRGVCEHAHLGGACDHVDAHVARDTALGGGNEGVTGTHDLLDGRDGLSAIGCGSDGLGTSHGIQLVHTRDCRCCQRVGRE